MRGLALRLAASAAALLVSSAAGTAAENLDGYWMDSHGEVLLDIGRCGNARCGKVAWLKKPRGPDGAPLRDFRNPDTRLQSRFVCGMTVVPVSPVQTSLPPMTSGMSTTVEAIESSRALSAARSGVAGAYDRTGSLTGGGGTRIPEKAMGEVYEKLRN